MSKFLKHIFTGKDNETYDIGRFLWALGVLVYLGLSIYSALQGQVWHPMDFGTGLCAILAGGGFGVAIKSGTEP